VDTFRIGVIGAGIMGTDHARILHRDVPHTQIAMVADVDDQRARDLAAEFPDCAATVDPHELIASDRVDAVVIASSDPTHAEYVHACLAARKPALCEKPLAPTVGECEGIVAADREASAAGPRLVSVGFMRRFDVGYTQIRGRITDGSIGVPLMVHSVGRGVRTTVGTSEFSITGSAIHDFDVIPWLLDSPVVEVSWLAPRSSPDVHDRQDPQFILLRTADGVLSTVDIFLNAVYGYDTRCEVVGSRGAVSLTEPVTVVTDAALGRTMQYGQDWRPRFADAYRRQDRAWVQSLCAGTASPLATSEDGLRAALVADTVIESMRSGSGFVPVPSIT